MTAPLNMDQTQQATPVGYESRPVTKPPNWHGLVSLDMVLNNLSTGLFLVAAVGELLAPAAFRPLAPIAYPLALLFLLGDLVCLVLDLGDPKRFHHMLRVWKPGSPMSLGTWLLSAYAGPVTLLAILSLLPADTGGAGLEALRIALMVAGAVLAVGAAAYKGVLFSTTAQRGWEEARWMGGYLINSALGLGAAEMLLLMTLTGHGAEMADPLRLATRLLLGLNLVAIGLLAADVRAPLATSRGPAGVATLALLAIVAGVLLPLWLVGSSGPLGVGLALGLMLIGAGTVRSAIVQMPHRLAHGPGVARAKRAAATRATAPILLFGLLLTTPSRAAAQTGAVAPDSAPARIGLVLRAFYLNLASRNWDALAAYVLSPKLLERRGAPGELQQVVRDRTRSRGAPTAAATPPPACPSSASPMIDDAVIRIDGDWADVSVPRCSGPSPGVDRFGMLYFEDRWRFIYTDLFQAPPVPETAVR
jgi:hypothetical protein